MAAAETTTTTNTDEEQSSRKRKETSTTTEDAAGSETTDKATTGVNTLSTPPDGYVCHLCKTPGHWIQQCPMAVGKDGRKKKRRKKKNSSHVPVAGVDPSTKDIDDAREMQKIKPPNCNCGIPSRLKKVKRSHVNPTNSKAIGKYFFFCAKAKSDHPCRFARPVQQEQDKQKKIKKRQTKKEAAASATATSS